MDNEMNSRDNKKNFQENVDLKLFLDQSLSVIKEKLNKEIIDIRDQHGCNILHELVFNGYDIEKVKYVFDFIKTFNPSLLSEKSLCGNTFIHELFSCNNKLEVFDFILTNMLEIYPDILLEKTYCNDTILHKLFLHEKPFDVIKFVFDILGSDSKYQKIFFEREFHGKTFFIDLSLNFNDPKIIEFILMQTKNICPKFFNDFGLDTMITLIKFCKTKEVVDFTLFFFSDFYPEIYRSIKDFKPDFYLSFSLNHNEEFNSLVETYYENMH